MMRIVKEWYGTDNSSIYLQDWCFDDGLKHLTILYGNSLAGNKYEGKKDFRIEDLYNEESELVKLIQSDFSETVFAELKQTVKDYFEDREIINSQK